MGLQLPHTFNASDADSADSARDLLDTNIMPSSSTPRDAESLASRIASSRISSADRRRSNPAAITAAPASDAPITSWAHGFDSKRHFTATASTRGMVRPRQLNRASTMPLSDLSTRNGPAASARDTRAERKEASIDVRLGQCLAKHSRQWAQQVTAWENGSEGGMTRPELYSALRSLGLEALDAELDRCFDGHERSGVGLRVLDLAAVQRTIRALQQVHLANHGS
jgi:hypothetical protein